MRVTGITANLPVEDIATARSFYMDYLGLTVEGFNLGWVANYRSPAGRVSVQLVTRDATAPLDSTISVHVGASVDFGVCEVVGCHVWLGRTKGMMTDSGSTVRRPCSALLPG